MRNKQGMIRYGVAIGIACMASAVVAEEPAVESFSGGSHFNIFFTASTGDMIGWRFEVTEPITVTKLGVWRDQGTFGIPDLQTPKEIGIWRNSDQALLVEGTVEPGDTAIGDWRYTEVPSTDLVPGEGYTVAAMYTATDNDDYVSGATAMTTAAEVTWTASASPLEGSLNFVYPVTSGSTFGRFGTNFLFEPTGATCIADWNGDGEVDVNDFFAYLADFEAGDPRADLNNDGEIDINDFFIFLMEFEAGC